jgi:hypothetical protein
MATLYSIYAMEKTDSGHTLAFVVSVEASSPEGAVRAHYVGDPSLTPRNVTVIPARSVHHLTPKPETQTRLRF